MLYYVAHIQPLQQACPQHGLLCPLSALKYGFGMAQAW